MKAFFLCIGLLAFLSTAARAQEDLGRVMMILDGSGSMWGQIDGKAKITIAKEVMSDLIQTWDGDQAMGLMSYGHRRKGDCLDIEILSPVGPVNRADLVQRIQAINPKGKTPITDSILIAGTTVEYFKGDASSIVLVSDGLETCEKDPCAQARNMEVVNPKFTIHVVGFGVSEREIETLRCMADATGGQVFRASNAKQLREALDKTLAVAPPPPREPAKPSLFLRAKLCETCDPLPAIDVRWSVEKEGQAYFDGSGVLYPSDPDFPPGTYRVTARYLSSVLAREAELVIGADGQQVGVVNLEGGAASLFAYATEDQTLPADPIHYTFHPLVNGQTRGEHIASAAQSNGTTWLPAGPYRVVATHQQVKATADIEIQPGQTTRHVFDMRIGFLKPSAITWTDGPPAGGMEYLVYPTMEDALAGTNRVQFGLGGVDFALKPGTYVLKALYDYQNGAGSKVSQVLPVTVTAGERIEPVVNMNAGLLTHAITSRSGKFFAFQADYRAFTGEGDATRSAGKNISAKATVALPPGRYVMDISNNGEKTRTEAFEIKEGETLSLNVDIP